MDLRAVTVIIYAAVFFCAMVVSLAAKPRFVSALTCAFAVITGIGGLILYGYGYSQTCENAALAVIRTVWSGCGMFLGRNDYSGVSGAVFFQTGLGKTLFWMLHLIAMYATAGAAISTVGAGILRKIRTFLSRRGDLVLIFGVHPDSVAFGRKLSTWKGISVVYLDPSPDSGCAEQIRSFAVLHRTGEPGRKLLRSLGLRPGKRRVWLYALHRDQAENLRCALALLNAMELAEIEPSQSKLFLLGAEDSLRPDLVAAGDRYGYGDVCVMDRAELAARLLIRKYPPVKAVTFDETGRAKTDLNCLVLGFGRVGQAVLRQIVMHGQFSGSRFRADVFDPDVEKVSGGLFNRSPELRKHYDIRFNAADARSTRFYDYLEQMGASLNYVVVCAGMQGTEELVSELLSYFSRRNLRTPVYICGYSGVRCLNWDGTSERHPLYSTDVLWMNRLDRMAMLLNHSYCGPTGNTPEENWAKCDYFSRMSSRASADFAESFLIMAGTDRMTVTEEGWAPASQLLEHLSETEHLRWCAFHYCMGYRTMPPDVFRSRAKAYRTDSTVRIAKDPSARLHACLIPWEELDNLSDAENAVTGAGVDYKELDRRNVQMLSELLDMEET